MKARFLMIPILLVTASCQQEMDTPDPVVKPEEGSACSTFTLTIQASKGTETRALDLEGNELKPYWKDDDVVNVYKNGSLLGTIAVQCTGEKPTSATLTGTMTGTLPEKGDELTLLIPRETWSYTGQNGALTGTGSIEDAFDYATATVTVSAVEEHDNVTTVTTTAASFENQQSIYRFTFSDVIFNVEDFTIAAAEGGLVQQKAWGDLTETTGSITVKPTQPEASANPFFVAIRNNTTTKADTYHFIVIGTVNDTPGALLLGSKTIPAAAIATPGKFVSGTIHVSQPSFAPVSGNINSAEDVF